MKHLMLTFIAILGLSLAFQSNTFAQAAKKQVKLYGKSGTGGKEMNTPSTDEVRPNTKKRGSCSLALDNYTGYFVDVWVEDQYQGRLEPYARSVKINVWTPGNYTHWYAKTAGGTYYWSSDSQCNDNRSFSFNLKQ